jgi:guanine deaminase
MEKAFRGKILSPISDLDIEYFEDGVLVIGDSGLIKEVLPYKEFSPSPNLRLHTLEDSQGLMTLLPPFCDLHFHWVQDHVSEMSKDRLLDWLTTYVFPEEARFANPDFAHQRAVEFSKKLLGCGTLSGAVYASSHPESTHAALKSLVGDYKVGSVVMTENAPKDLYQTLEEAKNMVQSLLKSYGSKFVITPRFALSCNPETLKALGKIAAIQDSFIQTHLCETKNEVDQTLKFYSGFPETRHLDSYLEIYAESGLITHRTLLGHCIYLSDSEKQILKKTQAKIAHCPSSNAPIKERGLGSGLFDYRAADALSIDWALGSDIGAGPYLSMLDVMQSFLLQNRNQGIDPGSVRALYRSTAKGAELLELPHFGKLSPGYEGSFVAFPSSQQSTPHEILEELLERDRHQFNTLALKTVFKGEEVYRKKDFPQNEPAR